MIAVLEFLQEGDLIAHSTCKEKLLHVVQESGAVSWSKEGMQLLFAGELNNL